MPAEEVKALPIAQKIQIMEALWEDLRDRFDRLDLPESQKKLLDEGVHGSKGDRQGFTIGIR